jgi:hypothetical protein
MKYEVQIYRERRLQRPFPVADQFPIVQVTLEDEQGRAAQLPIQIRCLLLHSTVFEA